MAAAPTVPEVSVPLKSEVIRPRQGVVTLCGYGVHVQVERGHLVLCDGLAGRRREARFSRVNHGLRRLVVIGSDGMVSLAALRWLHDQKAAFVMVERNGRVLTMAGPVGPRAPRLKRAQATAHISGRGMAIARWLIDQKLAGQEALVRDIFKDESSADAIRLERNRLPSCETSDALRFAEACGAIAYWSAWNHLPVTFPKGALTRVPGHWRTFESRRSPISYSPRRAVNPVNAMLNYLYAILESEARIAAVGVGLDPNLGVLHADADTRASLACDLMEAVRPEVDRYVLAWIRTRTLRREWFFEERDGNCRLMAEFAERLTQSATALAAAVLPIAEMVAKLMIRGESSNSIATKEGKSRRRPNSFLPRPEGHYPFPAMSRQCKLCGRRVVNVGEMCRECSISPDHFSGVLAKARLTCHGGEARRKRGETRSKNAKKAKEWKADELPQWLTVEVYRRRVAPKLRSARTADVARCLSASKAYAGQIRNGKKIPHPRHWLALARLVGLASGTNFHNNEVQT